MNALVIGGGGREHALVWKLAQSPLFSHIAAHPGNPGIARTAQCAQLDADLTVVGPEAPLVDGIVDQHRAQGKKIIGPTAAAAQLEGSKIYAKELMIAAGVPTARYVRAATVDEAHDALNTFSYPLVLKADGLAAGKGVVIVQDEREALETLPRLFTIPGKGLVIEEYLVGEEVSFIALTDGDTALPLEATQDHKTIFDGDTGPNTGGMGAYCDGRILTPAQVGAVMDTVVEPVLAEMRRRAAPFTGFLYAGLIYTANGPRVLEFNVRLGDPETQCLLHRLDSDLGALLWETANGNLRRQRIAWKADASVCVVMAAHGYPGTVRTGDEIHGICNAEQAGASVFHAGTRERDGRLETSGGRVLGVTAAGPTLQTAIANAYSAVNLIRFQGMQYRKDIARKGLKRW